MKVRSSPKKTTKATRGRPARASSTARTKGKSASRSRLILPSDCTAGHAERLKRDLCAVLKRRSAVTLDAAAVERIDTVSLQLLVAFVRDRRLEDRTVAWHGVSDVLNSAARLLGMDSMLSLDEVSS